MSTAPDDYDVDDDDPYAVEDDDEYPDDWYDDEPVVCEPTFDDLVDQGADDLYEPEDPLAGYPCPVYRRHKPHVVGRPMVDVLPSL